MINSPDAPLRTAYLAALEAATGIDVWAGGVPKTAVPGNAYILLTTQTKTRTAVAKPTGALSDNFDWLASITIDITVVSPSGFANPGALDALEEKVINVAENIMVPLWCIKSRVYFNTQELPLSTSVNYFNRRTIIYQHWIQIL